MNNTEVISYKNTDGVVICIRESAIVAIEFKGRKAFTIYTLGGEIFTGTDITKVSNLEIDDPDLKP